MSRIPNNSLRLDAAVSKVLVEPVSAPERVELQGLQATFRGNGVTEEGLDPPSLVGAVFGALMPRVTYPGVLRLERRLKILERLEARAATGGSDDPVLAGSLRTLRHELQNLSLLHRHRDRLIEG